MSEPSKTAIVTAILEEYGTTFSEELRIHIDHNTPSPLFQYLCFSLLSSTRIGHEKAVAAAKALFDSGWTTVKKMAESSWEDRTRVLDEAGYARYEESTSSYLGDTAGLLLETYSGDLRNLREAAEHDPEQERHLLKQCKGIGDVGVDIFFREVQQVWSEVYPFADNVALEAARKLNLGGDPESLVRLVDHDDYVHLVTGLVRIQLENGYDKVQEAVSG